jgi:hypothetical protein
MEKISEKILINQKLEGDNYEETHSYSIKVYDDNGDVVYSDSSTVYDGAFAECPEDSYFCRDLKSPLDTVDVVLALAPFIIKGYEIVNTVEDTREEFKD